MSSEKAKHMKSGNNRTLIKENYEAKVEKVENYQFYKSGEQVQVGSQPQTFCQLKQNKINKSVYNSPGKFLNIEKNEYGQTKKQIYY